MCVKPFAAPALVDFLITKVPDNRRQKMFKREHELCDSVYGARGALCCPKTHAGCNSRVNARGNAVIGDRLGNEVAGPVSSRTAVCILRKSWS